MKFAQPAWLVLLVLLPLIGVGAAVVAHLRNQQWAAFIAPRLRFSLLKHTGAFPHWVAIWALLAACAAIAIALARPRGDAGTRTEKSLGRNLLIALDLSRSMRVSDVKPDRLAQAKVVIHELLDAMPNERVGLIGFAGTAYVYAPLTVDHAAVRETIDQIDETWAPLGGSNLASAVQLATETLKKTGQKNNALVILSDGEKHEGKLDSMISDAKRAGVYILAIGVGTEDGDYVPNPEFPGNRMIDRSGKPVISRLQPEVLRKIASETHGRYAVANSGVDIPAMVKAAIKDLDAFEMEGRERHVYVEFYQWLALPAVIFLLGSILAATRWRGVAPATAAMVLFWHPAAARADDIAHAKQALRQHHYAEARQAYQKLADQSRIPGRGARFRLGQASAAYHARDFDHARGAFSQALLSHDPAVLRAAHAGLGNTLFQLGWQELTAAPYPDDPRNTPNLEAFDAIVRERLAKLRDAAEPADGEPSPDTPLDEVITNWADAVRHFDSAAASGTDPASSANRRTAMIYLKRLAELLKESRDQTEQAMPQPQPGEGPPQEGDGEPQDGDQDKGKPNDPPKPGGDQNNQQPPQEGSSGEQETPEQKPGEMKDDTPPPADPKIPDESPEERARRILRENADLEKGPLTPGRLELQSPKKDW